MNLFFGTSTFISFSSKLLTDSSTAASLLRGLNLDLGLEDHIKEAEKQLGDEEVYEEVSNDVPPLLETITAVIAKIRKRGDLKRDNLDYFIMKDPKFARFYLLPKIHKRLHNAQVDQ